MKHALASWSAITRRLVPYDEVLWLFDLDGTLAPIVSHPDQVSIPLRTQHALHRLSRRFPGRVGIVSGRTLSQLRRLLHDKRLIYCGTHGHEIDGPGLKYRSPMRLADTRSLKSITSRLRVMANGIRGLWIEEKFWSRCLHYRQTRPSDGRRVREILKLATQMADQSGLRLQPGLKALEFLPSEEWNKASAVAWLKMKVGAKRIFFIGDDSTDETVFHAFPPPHVTLHIGHGSDTKAAFGLPHQRDVIAVVERLNRL